MYWFITKGDLIGPGLKTCVVHGSMDFTTEPPGEPRFSIVGTKSNKQIYLLGNSGLHDPSLGGGRASFRKALSLSAHLSQTLMAEGGHAPSCFPLTSLLWGFWAGVRLKVPELDGAKSQPSSCSRSRPLIGCFGCSLDSVLELLPPALANLTVVPLLLPVMLLEHCGTVTLF